MIYKTLENNIKIVEYNDTLAPTIAEMWNKSQQSWGGGSGIRTAEQIIKDHSSMAYYNVYIALHHEEAVGYCSLLRSYYDENTLYIALLGVRPDYHGAKIGKALTLMCMERTIQLGYPRVDIHTWSGNVKAVPLYKKCGYLWEEREDSTYLVNFIPTLLKTELTKDFFDNADWYADSTRTIDITPDEEKVNKFGIFGYSWKKNQETLQVGFERSGKRIRMIETNDYGIEMMAETHESAFGLGYTCTYQVENKSGKDLDLKIVGKNDRNILFGINEKSEEYHFHVEEKVKGKKTFTGKFYVGETKEEQDPWRIHPCVLADVTINGKTAEFGLGIKTKVPIELSLVELRDFAKVGLRYDCHFNLTSALSQDVKVKFTLPENAYTHFYQKELMVDLPANGKATVKGEAIIKQAGVERLEVAYDVRGHNTDSSDFSFTYPFHLVNQDFTKGFSYEDEKSFVIVNGPWSISHSKGQNGVTVRDRKGQELVYFDQPKLGKPYEAEFDALKPVFSSMGNQEFITLKAAFQSQKYKDIKLTFVHELSASGMVRRYFEVENTGLTPQKISVFDQHWIEAIGIHTEFEYKGKITQNSDGVNGGDSKYGTADIEPSMFTGNWLFDKGDYGTFGVTWDSNSTVNLQYGECLGIESDCEFIPPGECHITIPVEYVFGIFNNSLEFRNYAKNLFNHFDQVKENVIQVELNGHNPMITSDTVELKIHNNRSVARGGKIKVSSHNLNINEEVENPQEEIITCNSFKLEGFESKSGVQKVNIQLDLVDFRKGYERAVFSTGNSKICQEELEGVLSVSNGRLTFKVAPSYSDAMYSLISHTPEGENEWLFSRYPNHEPYGFANVYIGGCQNKLDAMPSSILIKEKVTGEFVSIKDSFGNLWQGIKSMMKIEVNPVHRGIHLESYYLTMANLPLVCQFYKVNNETGHFHQDKTMTALSITGGLGIENLSGKFTDKAGMYYEYRFGNEENTRWADCLVEFVSQRQEKLYLYKNDHELELEFDNKVVRVHSYEDCRAENLGCYLSKPMFLIPCERELTKEMLEDLRRIRFSSEDLNPSKP